MRDQASKGRNVTSAATGCMVIVRSRASGIRRVARKDGAWDSQDSVSVSLAPPDENVLIVQMGSSVSFVRRPAHLQRRVTEGATALGTAHVAA